MIGALAATSRALAWLAGALVLAAALLISADVVLRNAFRVAPFHSFELSRYAFGASVALGLAFAVTERANIRIDILHRLLPRRAHAVLDVLALLALAPVALAFAWYAWDVARESLRLGAVSNTPLAIRMTWPQGVFAAGLSWFAFVCCAYALTALAALLRGDTRTLDRVGGMPGLSAEAGELAR
jgi:TRAP-type C4-dicarboxylate transport system permease small subunit